MAGSGKSDQCKARAQEIRSIANDLPTSNIKQLLLSLAVDYDRLASLLDSPDKGPVDN